MVSRYRDYGAGQQPDFAALLARTEDGWEASDTELDDVETLADLADLAREAAADEGETVLVFIEQEDAFGQTADDLLQLVANRLDLRAVAREAAPEFAQTLCDTLHLDIDRARLGMEGALCFELLDAVHHFAQRPEDEV